MFIVFFNEKFNSTGVFWSIGLAENWQECVSSESSETMKVIGLLCRERKSASCKHKHREPMHREASVFNPLGEEMLNQNLLKAELHVSNFWKGCLLFEVLVDTSDEYFVVAEEKQVFVHLDQTFWNTWSVSCKRKVQVVAE